MFLIAEIEGSFYATQRLAAPEDIGFLRPQILQAV